MKYVILDDGRVLNEYSEKLLIAKNNGCKPVAEFFAETYTIATTEKPKKLVTKEAKDITDGGCYSSNDQSAVFAFPRNAKNVKCTYEIEE